MRIMLKIELEDVNTGPIGCNFMMRCASGEEIIFSDEALDEFMADAEKYKLSKLNENTHLDSHI